jgi:rod shape-determining protein MreB
MDRAIVDYLRRNLNLKVGLSTAEQLKIDIGSAASLDHELVDEVRGVDAASGLPRRVEITSQELRQALAEPLEEIVEAIHATLDHTGPELASDLVDHGLVLAGGGALLRGLDRYLTEKTGLPARISPDALVAVSQGNAICLEHLDQWRAKLETQNDDV